MRRPRDRGECRGGERPCPWVSCRYHLLLDVDPDTGTIWLHPDVGAGRTLPEWLPNGTAEERADRVLPLLDTHETCSLDVADRGEHTNRETGKAMGLQPVRVKEIMYGKPGAEGARAKVKRLETIRRRAVSGAVLRLMRQVSAARRRGGSRKRPSSVKGLKRQLLGLSGDDRAELLAAWEREVDVGRASASAQNEQDVIS